MGKKTTSLEMPRGGPRPGAGRKKKDDADLRKNRSMKMLDETYALLQRLADQSGTSVAGAVDWFAASPDPEAREARKACKKAAKFFVASDPRPFSE